MGSPEEAKAAAAANKKAQEARDDLPPYSETPSSSTAPLQNQSSEKPSGPTVESPFNFPSTGNNGLPAYSPHSGSSSTKHKPIAIPQTAPTTASPFLDAFSPALLNHGITEATWRSFLDTISAFLTAKVSDKAIAHAGDIGREIGNPTKALWKDTVSHFKGVQKGVKHNAKKGNVWKAAFGVVSGAVSIPVSATFGTIGAVVETPFAAAGAVLRKPMTPLERGSAYINVANQKWLYGRGLSAALMFTEELSEIIGTSVTGLVDGGKGTGDGSVEGLMRVMESHVARLEVRGAEVMDVGAETLWLVLMPVEEFDEKSAY